MKASCHLPGSDTQYRYSAVHQLLGNPVDGRVALCTDQDLIFAVQGLVDGFYKSGGLSGPRRTVNDGYVFGAKYFVDCCFLSAVQPRETDRIGFPPAGGLLA